MENHAVIKIFRKRRFKANRNSFQDRFGVSSPSISAVKKWAIKFKHGCESVQDDPCEGCPKSATSPEIIEKVHYMILEDQRTKVRIGTICMRN